MCLQSETESLIIPLYVSVVPLQNRSVTTREARTGGGETSATTPDTVKIGGVNGQVGTE